MPAFTESVVEDAALAWLESLGYTVKHGPEIGPGELFAERADYGQVLLADRLCQALERINPALPAEAIEDAFRKVTRLDGATIDGRNRAFHRLLVDGVTVEYRTDGAIRGARRGCSISTIPTRTSGSRSTSLPSSRISTIGGRHEQGVKSALSSS